MKILRWFSKKQEKGLHSALEAILGKARAAEVFASAPDTRTLVAYAAALYKIEEESLVEEIARKLEMPYLPKVPSAPGSVTKDAIDLSGLEEVGAAVLYSENVPIALAAVDPARLRERMPNAASLPMYLASLSSISAWISEIRKRGAVSENELREVITKILDFALPHQANSIVLTLEGEDQGYSFTTGDGKRAAGALAREVSCSLKSYLERDEAAFINIELRGKKVTHQYDKETGELSLIVGEKVEKREAPPKRPRLKAVPKEIVHSAEGQKILLIDDNDTFRYLLKRKLEGEGYRVETLSSGLRAYEELLRADEVPALIVCDLHMPSMTGYEFISEISKLAHFVDIPKIVLTSDEDVETEISLYELGVEAFVRKSEDPRVVVAQVKRILDKNQRRLVA